MYPEILTSHGSREPCRRWHAHVREPVSSSVRCPTGYDGLGAGTGWPDERLDVMLAVMGSYLLYPGRQHNRVLARRIQLVP